MNIDMKVTSVECKQELLKPNKYTVSLEVIDENRIASIRLGWASIVSYVRPDVQIGDTVTVSIAVTQEANAPVLETVATQ